MQAIGPRHIIRRINVKASSRKVTAGFWHTRRSSHLPQHLRPPRPLLPQRQLPDSGFRAYWIRLPDRTQGIEQGELQ
jgi:hypothetical protein